MKGVLRKILYGLCILGAGLCIGFLIHYCVRLQQNRKLYESLQMQETVESAMQIRETVENETENEVKEKVEIPINFEELWQINPEIYAWIEIPDTPINYPIVQSMSDDAYYLDHTIEGIAGYPGSIYTERINTKDFTDFNTLIYGHDMLDGSMFAGLHKFADETYLHEHETMLIYTAEHKYTYRIFKALIYDDRHIMGSFDFSDFTQREVYLDSIGNSDSEVTTDSRLVTMSTCIADQPSNRFLVEAVLINEE